MLFIMLFFFAEIMLKNMLFALHYAKLFEILLNYALHQKFMSLSTAGQNKCLFRRNLYLGIQALSWCQPAASHARSCDHWRGRKKEESSKLLRSHSFSIEKEKEKERKREREREREREKEGERERERERKMRMRGSLGEILAKGRNFVVAGHRPLTRTPIQRLTPI